MTREELDAAKSAMQEEIEAQDLAEVDAYRRYLNDKPDSTLTFLSWRADADWLAGKPITEKRVVTIGGSK